MSEPVVVTAYFHPLPGRLDAVLEALRPAIEAVHAEPGCQLYAIHQAPDDTVVMIEKWTSEEYLDVHGSAGAVATLNEKLDGLLQRPVDVTRLRPIPAGTAEQGQL